MSPACRSMTMSPTRIADSIGPAFEGFAPIAGTLPFDLEPRAFLLVQTAKVSK